MLCFGYFLLFTAVLSAQSTRLGWEFGGQAVFNKISAAAPGESNASQLGLHAGATVSFPLGRQLELLSGVQMAYHTYAQRNTRQLGGFRPAYTEVVESYANVIHLGMPVGLRWHAGEDKDRMFVRGGFGILVPVSVSIKGYLSNDLTNSGQAVREDERIPFTVGEADAATPTVLTEVGVGYTMPNGRAYFEANAGYTLTRAVRGVESREPGDRNYLSDSRAVLVGLTFGSYFGRTPR